MLLVLALSLAAVPPAEDIGYTPASVFPPVGDSLPANGRVVVFDAAAADDGAFLLHRGDQSVETLAAEIVTTLSSEIVPAPTAILTLPPLDVGEAVALETSCGSCGETFAYTVVAADTDAPQFTDVDVDVRVAASRERYLTDPIGGWSLMLCLPPLVVAEPTVARFDGDLDGLARLEPCGDGDDRQGAFFYFANDDDAHPEGSTVCFDVFAVDAAGNESAALPLCIELVDESFSCAQSSSAAASSFGLLGLALLLVRRRH